MRSYPCGTAVKTNWLSETIPGPATNQEIVFKIELAEISRIKRIDVEWLFAPRQIKIEYSSDNYLYDIGKMWYKLRDITSFRYIKDS